MADVHAETAASPFGITAESTHEVGDGARFVPGALVAVRYRLVRKIGEGAMAEVWHARHVELNSDVALKLAFVDGRHDLDRVFERFRFEAQLSAQLGQRCEHIVRVFDAGRVGDVPFLVMEYVDGQSLEELLDMAGTIAPDKVADLLEQLAAALTVAHEHGIWHRDMKPGNVIIVDRDGRWLAKLADFGVAKTLDESLAVDAPKTTTAGLLVGTPAFMSPEQLGGGPPSASSDLWSLAVLAYEALTGTVPFDGVTLTQLITAIATKPHQPAGSFVPISSAMDAWFARALDKDPARRFATAEEMAAAFRAALSKRGPSRKVTTLIGAAALVAVTAAAVALQPDGVASPAAKAIGVTLVVPQPAEEPSAIASSTSVAVDPPSPSTSPSTSAASTKSSGASPRPKPKSDPSDTY